jgi:hypothetical protein
LNVESVSIMGKQRFWKGGKGYYDSNAHQWRNKDGYFFEMNWLLICLKEMTFTVFTGPMVTVFGNVITKQRFIEIFMNLLEILGLEMEGSCTSNSICF